MFGRINLIRKIYHCIKHMRKHINGDITRFLLLHVCMPFGFLFPAIFRLFGFPVLLTLSVLDDGYSRNLLCAITHDIYVFILLIPISQKIRILQHIFKNYVTTSVKPVLRSHHWDKEKWYFKTDDLLKEVQFIWNAL